MDEEKSIYDKIVVICEDEQHYYVSWFDGRGVRHSIADAPTASMALALKQAYCNGWYDCESKNVEI